MNNENLKPFEKGDPRINREGLKRGTEHSSTRLRRLLDIVQKKQNPLTGKEEEFTTLEMMDMAMILKAIKGNERAYQEVIDRLEGKSQAKVDLTSGGESLNPLTIITRDEATKKALEELR